MLREESVDGMEESLTHHPAGFATPSSSSHSSWKSRLACWHSLPPGVRALIMLLLCVGAIVLALVAILIPVTVQEGELRTYYIAAERVSWNYAPQGRNLVEDREWSPAEQFYVERGANKPGTLYVKARFREYTDEDFDEPMEVDEESEQLGLLGPVIRAEEGDTIRVIFKNMLEEYTVAIKEQGVLSHEPESEKYVAPGAVKTYEWLATSRSGPAAQDLSSVGWVYKGVLKNYPEVGINLGLLGPIVVTNRGSAAADATPLDIDREFFAVFSMIDENLNPFLRDSLPGHQDQVNATAEFVRHNQMHNVNGYIYGNRQNNTAPWSVKLNDRVRWYLFSIPGMDNFHSIHFDGVTLDATGHRLDSVSVPPGTSIAVDMVADNPGKRSFHDHMPQHNQAGMQSFYCILGGGDESDGECGP